MSNGKWHDAEVNVTYPTPFAKALRIFSEVTMLWLVGITVREDYLAAPPLAENQLTFAELNLRTQTDSPILIFC